MVCMGSSLPPAFFDLTDPIGDSRVVCLAVLSAVHTPVTVGADAGDPPRVVGPAIRTTPNMMGFKVGPSVAGGEWSRRVASLTHPVGPP